MKHLHIIRHGKAAANFDQPSDFERPLIQKGIDNCKKVISFLKSRDFKFDLAATSPAKRAFDTAIIFAESFDYPKENILVIDNLYGADLKEMFLGRYCKSR